MLARLQRRIYAALLLVSLAWLAFWWRDTRWLGWLGFAWCWLGFALMLAYEFVALRRVPPLVDAVVPVPPRPGWAALLRAWAGEVVHAVRVFGWRQPFASAREADVTQGFNAQRVGVVLVHGYFCNRGFWAPWIARLRAQGHCVIALDLEPVFTSIDDYAPTIDAAAARVTQLTGRAPVLVCHSMGGLAARAWLRAGRHDAPGAAPRIDRVARIVTLGSPHRGTWLARASGTPNGRQMRIDNAWLQQLAADSDAAWHARFVCWYSDCDNIVFPVTTAALGGADNRLCPGVAHVALAFDARVMDDTLAWLRAQ
ncbi:MAG: esterase/lipase family protein [Burkholderiaceae bacterium]